MSFQDLEGTSTQPPGLRKTGTLIEMASSIFRLNTSVARFRRLVDAVGTAKDSLEHRRTLFDARQSIGRMVKEISGKLKALTVADSTVPSAREWRDRSSRGLPGGAGRLPEAQKLLAEREFAYVPPPPSPRQISKSHLIIDQYAEDKELCHQSRKGKRGSEKIQHQVAQVNEIFHDLAVLIGQQGIVIDDIVKNIEAASAETADAEAQFAKGSNSMKSRSSWWCWVLVIVAVVLVVVVLISVL
ncbi:unnamed protein product [Spirodela intermedia]|uniref:t-SNARE coiled-coil homology domain-containing protein n=1 Tax=Spirodela intermedia TaxID=51605 RepID=A0A7I8JD92_SPIIN|nr:unnamed protein product [Spirodela intermedia]CAA6668110.1 unnamed protein product [Spirodela intermedia]